MKILGIIPARYSSSRFPGKPLVEIRGKSMLERVYTQAKKSTFLKEVVIATDDERIKQHAESFHAKVIMTSPDHQSGTDRCYEAYVKNNCHSDYIVNIQGDEPFIDPCQVDLLASVCDQETELATLMIKCKNEEDLFDPGEVKIVLNCNQEALYFSRAAIPFQKSAKPENWHKHFPYFRHVGMYAYRRDCLEKITNLKASSLEIAESLEQLRWLENGFKIRCVETSYESYCIDSPEDVEKVINALGLNS
jgi:3-deoxy-manno-octulosonate cytidylyltransferase (CMP-KDO synthetase)